VTERPKGPASYFPSIEAKYGRPVLEWQRLLRERRAADPGARHSDLVG